MPTGIQLMSTITREGQLQLATHQSELPGPGEGQVLIRIEAAPINPSDMWPLFGPADLRAAEVSSSDSGASLTAPVDASFLPMVHARLDQTLPVGNEGAGVVIEAGAGAEHLIGKTVSLSHGASYAQFACVPAQLCLVHNEGTTPAQAASSFVNPLTALGMVETMRLEGHTALVHTAAASNLGQMLNKICLADGVDLINIVRSAEQVELLQSQGAKIVLDSSTADFKQQLFGALDTTGATLAFDAVGGGQLASDILAVMEQVLSKDASGLNTYGSEAHKQVYLYGMLDTGPTVLNRSYGMSWGVGGWLLPRFLQRIGLQRAGELQQRVADEITTTFASHFTDELSLTEMLEPANIGRYVAKKTGEKFLVNPHKS
ncbi:MAG: NADH oxidase [Gammaproteobacteria bacterium]|nr:NADH oxidase [Gammaproteobacteria bacterium]